MENLIQGQNSPLTSTILSAQFNSDVGGEQSSQIIELNAFLLAANGQVPGDHEFVFYNQPAHPSACLSITPERSQYALALDKTPASIERIVLTVTLDQQTTVGQLNFGSGRYAELVITGGSTQLRFHIDTTGMNETSLILGDFYRRNGTWKFKALGQGFIGGLEPMAKHFGVEVGDTASPTPMPAPELPVPIPSAPAPLPESGSKSDNLSQMAQGLFNNLKEKAADLKIDALKFKNKPFLDAAMAGSALIALADGVIVTEEKRQMLTFIEHYEPLSIFKSTDIITAFQGFVSQLESDQVLGEVHAYEAIRKMKSNDLAARLIMRLIIAIAASDGHFDDDEKQVARKIAIELGLDFAEFHTE